MAYFKGYQMIYIIRVNYIQEHVHPRNNTYIIPLDIICLGLGSGHLVTTIGVKPLNILKIKFNE